MRKTAPLYLTDADCAAKMGLKPATDTNALFTVWQRAGFPKIDVDVGKRYWPAVRVWLDHRHGMRDQYDGDFSRDGETSKVEPLYVTEAECMERIGIDKRHAKNTFKAWERAGFPTIDMQAGKRYWPAVQAWLDRRNGLNRKGHRSYQSFEQDGVENWSR